MKFDNPVPRFKLIIEFPRPKIIGCGTISMDKKRQEAIFLINGKVIHELHRVKLEWAGADGILLSGMEPNGSTPQGQIKYKYQEWYLNYHLDDEVGYV